MPVDSCKIFKSMTELQLPNLYESKIFYIGLLLGNKIIKVGTQGTLNYFISTIQTEEQQ